MTIEERAIEAGENAKATLEKYIEDMTAYIDMMTEVVRRDIQSMEETKKRISSMGAKIADAKVRLFVEQHPEITLRHGDQLLATPEFFEHKRSMGIRSSFHSFVDIGCHVEWIGEDSEGISVRIDDNESVAPSSTFVPLAVAEQMRQAWLAQEAKS